MPQKFEVTPAGATRIDLTEKARALVRLSNAVNTYQSGMFSPGQPMQPVNGDESPRLFEYQPGVNLMITPRMGFGAMLSFPALRALAQVKEVRLNIELIKRTICGMEWEIVPDVPSVEVDGATYERTVDTDAVRAFFEKPDGVNEWDAWLKMLLEDLLVIDAVTLYPDMQFGELRALEIVDGATIRPLIDSRGRIPRPPMPAFSQILYGIPSTWYDARQVIYKPLNAKSHTVYGESPIEWVLTAINTAIRHDAQRIAAFTDGNIPGAMAFVNVSTPEELQILQDYVDAIEKGQIARASHLLFMPAGTGSSVVPFSNTNFDNSAIDEYLFKVVCWAFGNSPSEFGIVSGAGLGGAGFMQGQENTQQRSMIEPVSGYVAQLLNRVIREYMQKTGIKFQWKDADPQEDKSLQAQVDTAYISAGVYGPDYVQDRLGVAEKYRKTAQATPQAPQFGGQPISLPSQLMPYLQRAVKADLSDWRERVRKDFKRNERFTVYRSKVIPDELYSQLSSRLQKVKNLEEIDAAFEQARAQLSDEYLMKSVVPAREVGEHSKPFRYP